jgi:hypothetical protein
MGRLATNKGISLNIDLIEIISKVVENRTATAIDGNDLPKMVQNA